jgi:hypothetical protein
MKEHLLNTHNLIGFAIAFFSAFILFPGFYDMTVGPIGSENYLFDSLDPSWAITLNYANIQNLKWGTDFAFTYGPLSYLAIKIGWGVSKWQFLVFDLFCFVNLFFFFFISYKNSSNKILAFLSILSVALILPNYLGGALPLVLFLTFVFYIRQNIEKPSWFYYIFSIILLALMFFIKFNTGLISFFPYYGMLIYLGIVKKEKIWVLFITAIVPIVLLFAMSNILNLDIYGYIVSGIEMVKGYNEIMFLDGIVGPEQYIFCYLFIFISIVYLGYKSFREKEPLLKGLFVLGIFAISVFVIYKQAFVRADLQHVTEFFRYSAVLMICFSIDFFKFKIKTLNTAVALVLISIPFFTYCVNNPNNTFGIDAKLERQNYITGYKMFTPTSGFLLFPNNNALPQDVLTKIGNETVDVYPWNIHLLLENKLNYLPRPVIQSYIAYTPYLEDLNFNHYNSDKAPKFVLYDYEGSDYRYPLFDETKMNLVLLKRYKIVNSFTHNKRNILLLEKIENSSPVKLTFIKEYAMAIESPIVPEASVYYEVEVYNNFTGKLNSFFTHAPEIALGIRTKNNTIRDFKTSKPLLQTGLFSNVLINTTEDFKNLMLNNTDSGARILQYNFKPKRASLFTDKIRIKEYKIE